MLRKKENIISIGLFLALFIFFVFYITTLRSRIIINHDVKGINGIFDFTHTNFETDKLNGLDGKVEFYWNQLLTPDDIKINPNNKPDDYIQIPGVWNGTEINGQELKGYGFATYHFRLLLPEDDLYGLKIKEFENAYKLWVNGKLMTETGIVGRTKESMVPSWRRKTLFFQTTNKVADVVIQVSNFQHRKGGPEDIIVFGKASDVYNLRNTLSAMELFLMGVLLILGTYHLVLYTFRPKDKVSLYFSIICLLIMIRMITTGEKVILEIMPRLNWLTAIKLEYLSYKLIVPFFLLFLNQFYREEISAKLIKVMSYIAAVFCLAVIFLPPVMFTYTPIVYQLIIVGIAIYAFMVLLKASLQKRENALVFFISYTIFFMVVLNDVLYYNKIINTGFLLPYGIFVLAYAQSIILSKNVSLAFINIERLSDKLSQTNIELEKKVIERTQQISDQKEELEKQANMLIESNEQLKELNAFKENLTDMIIHDLKSPLNIVLNFSKDDRVVFAGNQMLNLVHNLLDVQRYENSKMKLNLENISVHKLLKNAVFQMNFLIKEKNIELQLRQSKDYIINVDPEIIHRVFVNLLSNALKFTPTKGLVTIYIKEKLNTVSICFSDSGPGIPKDQKNVIFEKFGQFIVQRTGRSGSTGLGLTFCKMAIEAHQGNISFTSVLGKGATFCCTLPKTAVADSIIPKDNQGNISPEANFNALEFTTEDKLLLTGIIEGLASSKIYEIGKIKQLIKNIDPEQTDNIKLWINHLQRAMLNSDEELFKALIEKIK